MHYLKLLNIVKNCIVAKDRRITMHKERYNVNPVGFSSIRLNLESEIEEANKRLAFGKITDTTKNKARLRGYVEGLMRAQMIINQYKD